MLFTSCISITACFTFVLCYLNSTFLPYEGVCHSFPPAVAPLVTPADEALLPATLAPCPVDASKYFDRFSFTISFFYISLLFTLATKKTVLY